MLQERALATKSEVAELQQRVRDAETRVERSLVDLGRAEAKARCLVDELRMHRERRLTVWFNRIFDRTDLRKLISPAFRQLLDDSLIFCGGLKGFRLQPSIDLARFPFIDYVLRLPGTCPQGILFAVLMDMPCKGGTLSVELLSRSSLVLARCSLPLASIDETAPVRFSFSPSVDCEGELRMRVSVREAEWPVRLLEWRRYRAFGLGPLQTKPFCGLVLTQSF